MAEEITPRQKLALIHENLHEILKPEIIEDIVLRQNRPLKVYWGTATTGKPHCGYFVCIIKIAHFLRAGCSVKILLADIHGFLDNLKAPLELVKFRAEYYKYLITALLRAANVPIQRLEFVLGSSYQLTSKYTMDLFRLSSVVTEHDAKKAGAEVVKQVENATLSGLIYPLMQALDEEHLDVDAQFGGVDQRKIFTLAAEQLTKIGYKERAHMMNPMVPGLAGGKMSSSDLDSKIDVLDPADVVKRKLKKAHAAPREVEGNGIISFVEYVLLPVSGLRSGGKGEFVVKRKDQEPLVYTDISKLKEDYAADILTPQTLKPAVTTALLELLEPVQKEFTLSKEWQDVEKKAYPPPQIKKKEKKAKNLGTRFPGAAREVEAKADGHVEGKGKDRVNIAEGAEEAMANLDMDYDGAYRDDHLHANYWLVENCRSPSPASMPRMSQSAKSAYAERMSNVRNESAQPDLLMDADAKLTHLDSVVRCDDDVAMVQQHSDADALSGTSSGHPVDKNEVDMVQRLLDADVGSGNSSNGVSENRDVEMQAPSNLSEDSSSSKSRSCSSSPPPELSPTRVRDQLRYCLSRVKYAGSFTSSRKSQLNVDPGLHVDNIGNISLPLRSEDAEAIMKAGQQAPFGRGSETVVDTSFRNTQELNVDRFRLRNPAWTQYLQDIITPLGLALGFANSPSGIKAELYKLLIYEKGAMFKPHKDTEKTEGMFGTLVICLPSKHEGGSLVLSHRGEEVVCETAENSEFGQSHVAWYSDVVHEVKPVTAGYRLVLTYNLVRTEHYGPSSAKVVTEENTVFSNVLKEWKRRYDAGQPTLSKLAFVLEHKYSEANLSFGQLKGQDRVLGRYLKQTCDREEFIVLLANMTCTVYDADNSQTEEDRETDLGLEHVVDANGELELSSAKISSEEIIQQDCYDRWPDEVKTEETGNEGTDATHFYHDALSHDSIALWIRRHINILKEAPHHGCRDQLVMICMIEAKKDRTAGEINVEAIRACEVLQDPQLLLEVIKGCAARYTGLQIHHAVADAIHTFSFAKVQPSLNELTSYESKLYEHMTMINNIRCHYRAKSGNPLSELAELDVWETATTEKLLRTNTVFVYEDASCLVDIVKRQGEVFTVRSLLPALKKHHTDTVALLPFLAKVTEAGRTGGLSSGTAIIIFECLVQPTASGLSFKAFHSKGSYIEPAWYSKPDYCDREQWENLAKHLAYFYCQCVSELFEEEARSVLAWLQVEADTANVRIFPRVIIPFLAIFLENLQTHGIPASAPLQSTCQHVIISLLHRCVGMEPAKPSTWTRKFKGCYSSSCEACSKLRQFFEDPTKESAVFNTTNLYYSHLQFYTSPHESAVDHAKGTLEVTKTNKDWEYEHKSWQTRFDDVRKVLGFLRSNRELLGERYEELASMRIIRVSEEERTTQPVAAH
ncbi:MAG: hypothetical protein Q9217_001951 [Psora testacea]